MTRDLGYRPAVGVMLINRDRKVWVGQRIDSTLEAWQMPQGGLDKGEDPLEGAYRELEEETGIGRDLIEIVTQAKDELTYDLPDDLIGKIWKENWRPAPGLVPDALPRRGRRRQSRDQAS